MLQIAVKMLFGDRGKYLGIVTGIALASVLMIQQPGILISIFARTYSFITDVALPDIWVMDPMAAYLDVALAQAQKSTTEADIPTLEAGSRQAIHRLGILLAREPNALAAELSAARPLPWPEALTASGLPAELLARRPDLRRAERQLAAASADIGIATAELYPKFDLTLGLGLQASSAAKFAQAASRYWSIAPGVTVPLFDAGKRRAVIEGKRAIYDESLARYRAAFLGALEDVENALAAHYAEQTRRRALADSVQSDEEAVALATERYRRGLTSFLDVLTAQNALYGAQRSLSQSEANQLTDLITLYKALGGGWNAADVRLTEGRSSIEQDATNASRTLYK